MELLRFKHNVEPERKLILLEHSLLPAFQQQPSLRFPGTALPAEAVVSKKGQRNPSTWSPWGSGGAPLPSPLWVLQSWDLQSNSPNTWERESFSFIRKRSCWALGWSQAGWGRWGFLALQGAEQLLPCTLLSAVSPGPGQFCSSLQVGC